MKTFFKEEQVEVGSPFQVFLLIASGFPDVLLLRKIRVLTTLEDFDFDILGSPSIVLGNSLQEFSHSLLLPMQIENFTVCNPFLEDMLILASRSKK